MRTFHFLPPAILKKECATSRDTACISGMCLYCVCLNQCQGTKTEDSGEKQASTEQKACVLDRRLGLRRHELHSIFEKGSHFSLKSLVILERKKVQSFVLARSPFFNSRKPLFRSVSNTQKRIAKSMISGSQLNAF